MEIGSRALRNQFVPKVLCKLKTSTFGGTLDNKNEDDSDADDDSLVSEDGAEVVTSQLLEIPPRDLLRITQTLEEALRVARSSRCRRIIRSVT